MSVNGSVATISFENAGNGLTSFSKELTTFEIAGANKVFYPAKASINRSSVSVSSPMVKEPVAVRYDFWSWQNGHIPFSNYIGWFAVALLLHLYFQKGGFFKRNKLAPYVYAVQFLFFICLYIML